MLNCRKALVIRSDDFQMLRHVDGPSGITFCVNPPALSHWVDDPSILIRLVFEHYPSGRFTFLRQVSAH